MIGEDVRDLIEGARADAGKCSAARTASNICQGAAQSARDAKAVME